MTTDEDHISFVRRSAREMSDRYFLLYDGGDYYRTMPRILNAPSYIYDDVIRNSGERISPPTCSISEISNAVVRAPGFVYAEGGILDDALVNLYGSNLLEHWMPVSPIENGQYKAKRTDYFCSSTISEPAVLLAQNSDKNYGHWLVECLPKIDLVKELYDITRLKFVVGHPSSKMIEVYSDSLKAVGVERDQIIELSDAPIHFSCLIYPGPITKHPWITSPRAINFLTRLADDSRKSSDTAVGQRVYLPRNQIGRRCLINEEEICKIVEGHGFVSILPESMSFQQQKMALCNAKIVVGNLGGAITNIVFAPPGVKLLATTTELMADDFFFDIVSQKRGSYVSIHGKASQPELGMQSDFWIDPESFRSELDQLIADL